MENSCETMNDSEMIMDFALLNDDWLLPVGNNIASNDR